MSLLFPVCYYFVLKGMKAVRRFVSIIPGMLLFCFKGHEGSEDFCLYYSRYVTIFLKGMKGVRRFVSIIPGMLLFCFKGHEGSEEICLYYSRYVTILF